MSLYTVHNFFFLLLIVSFWLWVRASAATFTVCTCSLVSRLSPLLSFQLTLTLSDESRLHVCRRLTVVQDASSRSSGEMPVLLVAGTISRSAFSLLLTGTTLIRSRPCSSTGTIILKSLSKMSELRGGMWSWIECRSVGAWWSVTEQCRSVGAWRRCRSVTEQCRSVTERWQTWPQLMCCALSLKNLVSVNFRLWRKGESCGAKVEWCGSKRGAIGSKCGAIGSKCGAKGIKMRSKVEQNAEQGGAKRGARWSKTRSKVEQRICVFIWFQTGVLPSGKLI